MNRSLNFLLGVGVGSVLFGASVLSASAQTNVTGIVSHIVQGDANLIGDVTFDSQGGATGNITGFDGSRLDTVAATFGQNGLNGSVTLRNAADSSLTHSTFGGSGSGSGHFDIANTKVSFLGNTIGGNGVGSGTINVRRDSVVTIVTGTFGGSGDNSGCINVTDGGSLFIEGSATFGGSGVGSGCITFDNTNSFYSAIKSGRYGGSGANSGNVNVTGRSTVFITGGYFAGKMNGRIRRTGILQIQDEGDAPTIEWSGGTFDGGVFLGFEDDGGGETGPGIQAVGDGPQLIINGNGLFYETESDHYTDPDLYGDRVFDLNFISGTLLDGTALRFVPMLVEHGSNARITLNNVPEPGSIALLLGMASVSGVVLRRRHKRG